MYRSFSVGGTRYSGRVAKPMHCELGLLQFFHSLLYSLLSLAFWFASVRVNFLGFQFFENYSLSSVYWSFDSPSADYVIVQSLACNVFVGFSYSVLYLSRFISVLWLVYVSVPHLLLPLVKSCRCDPELIFAIRIQFACHHLAKCS